MRPFYVGRADGGWSKNGRSIIYFGCDGVGWEAGDGFGGDIRAMVIVVGEGHGVGRTDFGSDAVWSGRSCLRDVEDWSRVNCADCVGFGKDPVTVYGFPSTQSQVLGCKYRMLKTYSVIAAALGNQAAIKNETIRVRNMLLI